MIPFDSPSRSAQQNNKQQGHHRHECRLMAPIPKGSYPRVSSDLDGLNFRFRFQLETQIQEGAVCTEPTDFRPPFLYSR